MILIRRARTTCTITKREESFPGCLYFAYTAEIVFSDNNYAIHQYSQPPSSQLDLRGIRLMNIVGLCTFIKRQSNYRKGITLTGIAIKEILSLIQWIRELQSSLEASKAIHIGIFIRIPVTLVSTVVLPWLPFDVKVRRAIARIVAGKQKLLCHRNLKCVKQVRRSERWSEDSARKSQGHRSAADGASPHHDLRPFLF